MRTLVDLGDTQVEALDALSSAAGRSRASLIREAIDAYLAGQRAAQSRAGFGLWGKDGEDGLAYQDRIRGEW